MQLFSDQMMTQAEKCTRVEGRVVSRVPDSAPIASTPLPPGFSYIFTLITAIIIPIRLTIIEHAVKSMSMSVTASIKWVKIMTVI